MTPTRTDAGKAARTSKRTNAGRDARTARRTDAPASRPSPFPALLAALLLLAGACAPHMPPAASPTPAAAEAATSAPAIRSDDTALANAKSAALATRAEAVFPGAEWERIDRPESVGWSEPALEEVRQRLAELPSTGFIAVVGGRVLMEYGDLEAVSYLASVRKSILSMLYGIYVERGAIRLDKTLAELGIDDRQGLTDAEKEATIADIIASRSGIYHPASNAGDNLGDAPPRGSQRPGEYYLYSNWDFNAAGTIFEQETGIDIFDALEEHLARPLDMQDFDRSIHRKSGNLERSVHPAYHMHLSTRDMARIGYLMLRDGEWDGTRIVPRDWVRESTRAITPVHEMNPEYRRRGPFGYGYMWWVWDGEHAAGPYRGAYTGLGAVGQHIAVLPELDLVVAHKTRPGQGRSVSHDEFREILDVLVRGWCGEGCDAPVAR